MSFNIIYSSRTNHLQALGRNFQDVTISSHSSLYYLTYSATLSFGILSISSGVRCEVWRKICVGEEIELTCPPLELATRNNDYWEQFWIVTDPKDSQVKEYIAHCGKNPDNCAMYPLKKKIAKRIEVRTSVHGKISVKMLRKNDVLRYNCHVVRRGSSGIMIRVTSQSVNLNSSVNCE